MIVYINRSQLINSLTFKKDKRFRYQHFEWEVVVKTSKYYTVRLVNLNNSYIWYHDFLNYKNDFNKLETSVEYILDFANMIHESGIDNKHPRYQ